MLRTFVLLLILSVFIPVLTTSANQKEPYFYRIKPITRMEAIGNRRNKSYSPRAPYEYTLTAKPVTGPVLTKTVTEPVYMNPVTEPNLEKNYMIPAYILKSLELNGNKFNENDIKIKSLFSNIRPNQIEKIQLPIAAEDLVNPQIKLDFSIDEKSPENSYQKQLEMLMENDVIKDNLPKYRVTQFSTPLPMTAEELESVNEFTSLTDNTNNNPQLPVLTEKPIYDQNFLINEQARLSNLPELKDIEKYAKNAKKEKLLKGKLVSLFMASRKDVEKQMINTKSIHDTFKSGTMYKIGYLTSLINKMNNRIKKLYNTVKNNQDNWDSLKILEAYEQLKKDNGMIQKLVTMMQSYLRFKGKTALSESEALKGGDSGLPTISAISWSYYDDNLI